MNTRHFRLFALLVILSSFTMTWVSGQDTTHTPGGAQHDHNTPTPEEMPAPDLSSTTGPVPRYGIFEQTFNWSSGAYSNPWEQVTLNMTLTAPSGQQTTIGGFYYYTDTWKARFSPSETGNWTWRATMADGSQSQDFEGSFTVVDSDQPGFVRQNPDNPMRWVFDNGSPYYPIGLGDCIAGDPLVNWGFDEGALGSNPDEGTRTDIDTYLHGYGGAGFNLFRWSVDNCAWGLYDTIDPSGNVYKMREGLWGDELVQKLREHNFRIYMVIFGFFPPFPDGDTDPAKMAAVERAVQYAVNRYGAYPDFWELMNESPNPPITIADGWYNQVGGYLHQVDPYHHPVATSWQRPDLAVIDVTAPHWYQKEDEFQSDHETVGQINQYRSYNKPIIFGEQGNSEANWDDRSGLRMRIRSWTAWFNEGAFIFWNESCCKGVQIGYASNIFIGPEERGYIRVLQGFTHDFDRRAEMVSIDTSAPDRVRGFALRSPVSYAVYLHAYTDHTNPTSGVSVTVELTAGGTATWINPATGETLGAQAVSAGQQTLDVPDFVTDIALKITE